MALREHVFKMAGCANQYPKMLEQLCLYAGVQYPGTPEITTIFDDPPLEPLIQPPGGKPVGMGDSGKVTRFDTNLFEEKVKAFLHIEELLKGYNIALFLVIIGRCDHVLKSHLES